MRPLLGISTINIVGGFVFGGLGVLTVVLAVQYYNVGEAGTGLLNSAIGVGGVVGAFVAGALVLRRRLGPPMLVGAVAIGASVVALGILPAQFFGLALVAMGVASAGSLLIEIVSTTLLQRIVPDAIRGRTIGIMDTASVLAYAAGSFVLPVIAANDPLPALVASGRGHGGGRHHRRRPARPLRRPGRRRSTTSGASSADVELFAGLPPARHRDGDACGHGRDVTAGEVIIRQGDPADRFYVIVGGRVEVTQTPAAGGEARVLRQMGAGELFGEIGLLSSVPRTATVTAVTDGKLVA